MSQLTLDFRKSEAARDKGMKAAADHAGPTWMDLAVKDFVEFLRRRPSGATLEQWRYDWLSRGEEPPATHKAYGAVASAAARRGLAVNTGRYVKAKSERTHAHPVPIWMAA